MGFQINGTEVLGTSGIVNNANSFVNIGGTSVIGTGNITDTGSDALAWNTVGSYSVSGYGDPNVQLGVITQTSGGSNNTGAVSASDLYVWSNQGWGVIYGCGDQQTFQSYGSNTHHHLSGTWKHKAYRLAPRSGRMYFSLFQRIS